MHAKAVASYKKRTFALGILAFIDNHALLQD